MANLVRWRPQQELVPWMPFGAFWDQEFEDFFEDFVEPWGEERAGWIPGVEIYHRNGNYVIKADLPGVSAKDIHVSVEGGYLSIRGEQKTDKEFQRKGMHRKEVLNGSFHWVVPIPKGFRVEKIKAKYHDGVLEITAPYEKSMLPKPIKVEVEKTA